jgi:glycosyltransferase involved in cell wall biosynthesis
MVSRAHPTGVGGLDSPSVSIVLPALNEAANLPHVLADLDDSYELILVDGASTDATVDVARAMAPGLTVVSQATRGKGDALVAGFAAATGDIIVTLDADGSADPAEIPRFVAALVAGADFAKGSRALPGGGSDDLSRVRRAGNRALTGLTNAVHGSRFTDLCYGYNAFWRSCLPALRVDAHGFEVETLMHIRAIRAGLRVTEVPSFERRRLHGESHLSPLGDGLRVLRTIVRERLRGPSGTDLLGGDGAPAKADP